MLQYSAVESHALDVLKDLVQILEESEDPISLNGETWNSVKKLIQQKVNDYLK